MERTSNNGSYRWLSEPRWYLWEGGFFLIARADGVVPTHAHHAIQIVVAVDGEVAICGKEEEWRTGAGVPLQLEMERAFYR